MTFAQIGAVQFKDMSNLSGLRVSMRLHNRIIQSHGSIVEFCTSVCSLSPFSKETSLYTFFLFLLMIWLFIELVFSLPKYAEFTTQGWSYVTELESKSYLLLKYIISFRGGGTQDKGGVAFHIASCWGNFFTAWIGLYFFEMANVVTSSWWHHVRFISKRVSHSSTVEPFWDQVFK